MKTYKYLFIDWDDTIADWAASAYQAQQQIYQKYRLAEWGVDFQKWFALYHDHNDYLWEQYGKGNVEKDFLHTDRFLYPIVKTLGGDDILMKSTRLIEMATKMGDDFLTLTNTYFQLVDGAAEAVKRLSKCYPLLVLSNGFAEVQRYKIHQSGLESCFSQLVLSEEVHAQKPSAKIYECAFRVAQEDCRQRGVNTLSKEDILMIGDSYTNDILGARNVGIDQMWVCPSTISLNDEEYTATFTVRTLEQAADILCKDTM